LFRSFWCLTTTRFVALVIFTFRVFQNGHKQRHTYALFQFVLGFVKKSLNWQVHVFLKKDKKPNHYYQIHVIYGHIDFKKCSCTDDLLLTSVVNTFSKMIKGNLWKNSFAQNPPADLLHVILSKILTKNIGRFWDHLNNFFRESQKNYWTAIMTPLYFYGNFPWKMISTLKIRRRIFVFPRKNTPILLQ